MKRYIRASEYRVTILLENLISYIDETIGRSKEVIKILKNEGFTEEEIAKYYEYYDEE